MIRLICAYDKKLGIAKHGFQPWNIPEDEHYFNHHTIKYGATILQGKKTFDTIGHPLKDRTNYILSHEFYENVKNVNYINDLKNFLTHYEKDLWIIGGASLFKQTLEWADELYITKIEADFGCDQFFPSYESLFVIKKQSLDHYQNGFKFKYYVYQKEAS